VAPLTNRVSPLCRHYVRDPWPVCGRDNLCGSNRSPAQRSRFAKATWAQSGGHGFPVHPNDA
jgi:hypothetical protein